MAAPKSNKPCSRCGVRESRPGRSTLCSECYGKCRECGEPTPRLKKGCHRPICLACENRLHTHCSKCGKPREGYTGHQTYCRQCTNSRNREERPPCTRCGERPRLHGHGSLCKQCSGTCASCGKKQCECERHYQREYKRTNKTRTLQQQRETRDRLKLQDPQRAATKERRKGLSKNYGITPEEFDTMLAAQNDRCAGCGRTAEEAGGRWPRLHVDHCHRTGRVRGLLCHGCNVAIGHARDNPQTLRNLAAYLER